jgi:hypothetical protein
LHYKISASDRGYKSITKGGNKLNNNEAIKKIIAAYLAGYIYSDNE